MKANAPDPRMRQESRSLFLLLAALIFPLIVSFPVPVLQANTLEFTITYAGQATNAWQSLDGFTYDISMNVTGTFQLSLDYAMTTNGQSLVSFPGGFTTTNQVVAHAAKTGVGYMNSSSFGPDTSRNIGWEANSDSQYRPAGDLNFKFMTALPHNPPTDPSPYGWEYVSTQHVMRVWVALPSPFNDLNPQHDQYDFPATHTVANQSAAPSSLLGTITNAQGQAVAGAQAILNGTSSTADSQGRFGYDFISPGDYALTIKKLGYPDFNGTETIPPFSILQKTYGLPGVLLGFDSPPWSSGFLNLTLRGLTGAVYEIQASIDLRQWRAVNSLVRTNSEIIVAVPAATNSNYQFYRAAIPEPN